MASNVISFVVGGYFGTKMHDSSLNRECSVHTSAYCEYIRKKRHLS